MVRVHLALAAALALIADCASAFTIGSPEGLAAGTTGGANGKTVYPTSNSELVNYLASNDPLVIVLNKAFDFRGTEGTTTETGCRPDYTRECMAKNNGYKSQDVIIQGGNMATTGGCTGGTKVTVKYDNAALKRMTVLGNKTIRGIGKSGVIKGKGLTLAGDNIIVQNVHITELNHHLVWGGDAIYMQGTNGGSTAMKKIWLDHIKISRVGRQFITTNKASTDSMTISNSDFDGNTDYSASCDGHHYWSFIFYGVTKFSMLNNYIHGTSGRSPKIGGDSAAKVVAHVANNFWGNNSGHSFEIGENAWVLAEGNYFSNTRMPLFTGTNGALYAASSSDECSNYLGRSCAANTLTDSGSFDSRNGGTALNMIKGVSTCVNYKPDAAETTSGSQQQQQQQSSQSNESQQQSSQASDTTQQQQSSQNSDSEQQQRVQTSGSVQQESQSRKLAVQTSDLEKEWQQTTGNFGVGKLE
ncbi:pectin lyase F [Phytophthora nicotianae]|uniref:pectin lyase n=6 Tax=Phytophthora nicotianae TaxID=4792 RepID=A0A0W8CD27_PHYNI|nr:pectin lyase F [Phytophthora nicotianae]KUF79172.1 pectin lyase F [Phytophthora nicotianae]KUF82005.1 pectin lyase F [Phytophthora nicotianae]KUF82006.1 pectin lyase F [Phytophthora nicotianae]KUF88376.1 pectin lyase F [Phytophthora nicotianae]